MEKINVIELFAGVGGFRIGLEKASNKNCKFETIWANQWEPSTKRQHAAEIYVNRFGKQGFCSEDIEKIIENNFNTIPYHDLLVGGFPCQDYSVASTLKSAHGLIGKKGVLFWSIYTILKRQGNNAPKYILLENVDRLLKSPAKQRGKDFAVMLSALSDLGYALEWRVINAADYGFPQRRRRVFILGYKKETKLYKQLFSMDKNNNWLNKKGVLVDAFQVEDQLENINEFKIEGRIDEISKNFSINNPKLSPFQNAGVMIDRNILTAKLKPIYKNDRITLGDIIQKEEDVPEEFFIDNKNLEEWYYQKGAKKEERTSSTGHKYFYSEGGMIFPDPLDKPSRTIITGEGGLSVSRFKHVIKTLSGRYRRLTPIELERLNMFPDNHTESDEITNNKRAFMMGNALVIGLIQKIGESLAKLK